MTLIAYDNETERIVRQYRADGTPGWAEDVPDGLSVTEANHNPAGRVRMIESADADLEAGDKIVFRYDESKGVYVDVVKE